MNVEEMYIELPGNFPGCVSFFYMRGILKYESCPLMHSAGNKGMINDLLRINTGVP